MQQVAKWDPELNVGIGLIDTQHKIIFDLIKDLGKASEARADRKVIDTLLDVIENYVFRHFEAEEELFVHHKHLPKHCLEHYAMIKEFRKLRLGFRNRSSPENKAATFLEQWFLAHIKTHDIPLFASIANGGDVQTKNRPIDSYPVVTTERRRHKRIQRKKITDNEIVAECYSTSTLRYSKVVLIDISLGGMRINGPEPFTIGDLLLINCKIGRNFKLTEKVRIVNLADQCYGAEFINLSPVAEKFLIELYGAVSIKNF